MNAKPANKAHSLKINNDSSDWVLAMNINSLRRFAISAIVPGKEGLEGEVFVR